MIRKKAAILGAAAWLRANDDYALADVLGTNEYQSASPIQTAPPQYASACTEQHTCLTGHHQVTRYVTLTFS